MNSQLEMTTKTKALKSGQKLSSGDRIRVVQDIADQLLSVNVRPGDIAKHYGVGRDTGKDWLEMAYVLVERESKIGREGLRNIHRGQIEHMTNKLIASLDNNIELADKLAIHDRIIKYMDARARTNGLNSETIDHTHTLKPLEIRRAQTINEHGTDNTIGTAE